MGFKVDTDFLRFLTMGALASQRTKQIMELHGLQPIELERYSCSNKIWSTKVKRLRLPDLISANTGVRVEVRAKSKLAIKMSHSPENQTRHWDSSSRKEDLIAFACATFESGQCTIADAVELFAVDELRRCQADARLGPPKSASQGAERDLEWPSIVPSADGIVEDIQNDRLTIRKHDGRRFTYRLNGKHPYVSFGDSFNAEMCFLAGLPRNKAEWPNPRTVRFDPRSLLGQDWDVDRYAGVKLLGHIGRANDRTILLNIAKNDADSRVRLEAACSLARLGFQEGIDELSASIAKPAESYLRMEAVLMLAELRGSRLEESATGLISATAASEALAGDEVRQAAIWGLGRIGLAHFGKLIPFLDAEDEDERLHAIVAFGDEVPNADLANLVAVLADGNASDKKIAGAAAVLSRQRGSVGIVSLLYPLATSPASRISSWARAVLGQLPLEHLASEVNNPDLLSTLKPIALLTPQHNWTRTAEVASELHFLELQNL
jgi:hypothetical protein